MNALIRVTVLIVVLAATLMQHAQAATMLALPTVARAYGFVYTMESSEVAAHLSRPGVSLLVRPGDPRYQLNDDVQYAAVSPVFANDEIYVDARFERVLAHLAETHPWPNASAMPPVVVSAPPVLPPDASLSIAAHYIDTTETIAVSGKGPPGVPIQVVCKALLSRDIPAITIARATVYADGDGSFNTVVSAMQLTLENTALVFTATVGAGVKPASTALELGPPNPHLNNPNDTVPSD